MRVKEILLGSLIIVSFVACSNNNMNATDEERDALKILEEKREYYEKRDKEKAKEMQGYQVNMTEEEAKIEKEKLANMTSDEKLVYKVDKAKAKIDSMLEIAKKARQEELDVEETKAKVEEAVKNITGEAKEEEIAEEVK